MQRLSKSLRRFASFLFVIALVLCIIGLVQGGRPTNMDGFGINDGSFSLLHFNWGPFSSSNSDTQNPSQHGAGRSSATQSTVVPSGDISSVDIDLNAATVYLSAGDDFDLRVSSNPNYSNTIEYGVWTVKASNWNGDWNDVVFYITIPKDITLDTAMLSIDAGTIYVENLTCNIAEFSVDAGKIEASGITVLDSAEFKASAGRIDASDISVANATNIDVGLGSVTLDGELLGYTEIDCDMGSVKLDLVEPALYGYSINCDMGRTQIGNESFSGLGQERTKRQADTENFFDLDCGMGNIKISFK